MTGNGQGARHDIPVWGIFLLFLGAVLLLQTVNILPWSLWGTLWRYWPVLLIAGGAGILLRHLNFWLVSLVILLIFIGSLGLSIWQHNTAPPSRYPRISAELQEELDNVMEKINLSCEINEAGAE